MDVYIQISRHLEQLGISLSQTDLARLSTEAASKGMDHLEFLCLVTHYLEQERTRRRYDTLLRFSHIPVEKTLDSFDFSFQPELDESLIRDLARLGFVHAKQNVIFLSKPGRGKSHLATALGLACIRQGMKVYMAPLTQIIEKLKTALREGRLTTRSWAAYTRPSLLIIEDVASRMLDKQGCELFAELVSRRYERGSIVITSNRPFSKWPLIYDPEATEEAVDKLVHHSIIIPITGPSYRLKERLKQMDQLQ